MWRDSFAVPTYFPSSSERFRQSMDDDGFLLNLERQTGHLRRSDSSSFIYTAGESGNNIPLKEALLHQKNRRSTKRNEEFTLLSETPVDESLPAVRDMFVDFASEAQKEEELATFNNPLVPHTPPQQLRKQGSFATIFKVLNMDQTDSNQPNVKRHSKSKDSDDEEAEDEQDQLSKDSAVKRKLPRKTFSLRNLAIKAQSSLKSIESFESDTTTTSNSTRSTRDYTARLKDSDGSRVLSSTNSSRKLKHSDSSDSEPATNTTALEEMSTNGDRAVERIDEVLEKATQIRRTLSRVLKKSLSASFKITKRNSVEEPDQTNEE
jgi:hypothetical protein